MIWKALLISTAGVLFVDAVARAQVEQAATLSAPSASAASPSPAVVVDDAMLESLVRAAWIAEQFRVADPIGITGCMERSLGAAWPKGYLDGLSEGQEARLRGAIEFCVLAMRAPNRDSGTVPAPGVGGLLSDSFRGKTAEAGRGVNEQAMRRVRALIDASACAASKQPSDAHACVEKILGRPIPKEQARMLLANLEESKGKASDTR